MKFGQTNRSQYGFRLRKIRDLQLHRQLFSRNVNLYLVKNFLEDLLGMTPAVVPAELVLYLAMNLEYSPAVNLDSDLDQTAVDQSQHGIL